MAVQWATMIYEVTPTETLVRYIMCYDLNAELVFKVTIVPIGANARVFSVREEFEDSVCTIFCIHYITSLDV